MEREISRDEFNQKLSELDELLSDDNAENPADPLDFTVRLQPSMGFLVIGRPRTFESSVHRNFVFQSVVGICTMSLLFDAVSKLVIELRAYREQRQDLKPIKPLKPSWG